MAHDFLGQIFGLVGIFSLQSHKPMPHVAGYMLAQIQGKDIKLQGFVE